MRLILVSVLSVGLVGCGTPGPKPSLTYDQAFNTGKILAAITLCVAEGYMDTYVASRGKGFMDSRLANNIHDADAVSAGYNEVMESNQKPPNNVCADMAITFQKRINEINWQNELADRNRQSIQDAVNNIPKRTYCNRIGTQTMCSTY